MDRTKKPPAAAVRAALGVIGNLNHQASPDNTPAAAYSQARTAQRLAARRAAVQHLHRLGPRPVYELLDQLAREEGCGAAIDRLLERYSALPVETVRALGADRFPAPPIYRVVP